MSPPSKRIRTSATAPIRRERVVLEQDLSEPLGAGEHPDEQEQERDRQAEPARGARRDHADREQRPDGGEEEGGGERLGRHRARAYRRGCGQSRPPLGAARPGVRLRRGAGAGSSCHRVILVTCDERQEPVARPEGAERRLGHRAEIAEPTLRRGRMRARREPAVGVDPRLAADEQAGTARRQGGRVGRELHRVLQEDALAGPAGARSRLRRTAWTAAFHRAIAPGERRSEVATSAGSRVWTWFSFTRSTPSAAASRTMSASSPTFASWTVTWNETTAPRRPPAPRRRARRRARGRSPRRRRGRARASPPRRSRGRPVPEIFTSRRDRHEPGRPGGGAAAGEGAVRRHVQRALARRRGPRGRRAPPTGAASPSWTESPRRAPIRAARRGHAGRGAGSIRRGGRRSPPAARLPHSHMRQARLQSSGFVTRVSRHGPDARALRAPRPARRACVDNASVVTEK